MAKSKNIGVRIPDHLLREIENFGLTNFPKNESFDMTKSLLFLIQRGLQNEGIESPKSPAPSPSVGFDGDTNQNDLINTLQKKVTELENRFDEFVNGKNEINGKIEKRLLKLESQSNQEFKSLDNINDSPAPLDPSLIELGEKLNVNDFIFVSESYAKKHNLDENKQYKIIEKYFTDDDPLPNFKIADTIRSARTIDLKDIIPVEQETADQVGTSQETDSPDPLGLSLGIISLFDFFSKTGITMQTLNNWFKEDRAIPQKYQDYIEIHNKENKELLIKKLPIPIKQK